MALTSHRPLIESQTPHDLNPAMTDINQLLNLMLWRLRMSLIACECGRGLQRFKTDVSDEAGSCQGHDRLGQGAGLQKQRLHFQPGLSCSALVGACCKALAEHISDTLALMTGTAELLLRKLDTYVVSCCPLSKRQCHRRCPYTPSQPVDSQPNATQNHQASKLWHPIATQSLHRRDSWPSAARS